MARRREGSEMSRAALWGEVQKESQQVREAGDAQCNGLKASTLLVKWHKSMYSTLYFHCFVFIQAINT